MSRRSTQRRQVHQMIEAAPPRMMPREHVALSVVAGPVVYAQLVRRGL
jgi:hypothetical protein